MIHARRDILRWAADGHIRDGHLRQALQLAGVIPSGAAWYAFVDSLLLWMGVASLAAGLIFFFAFNWNDLGRLGRFALADGAVLLSLGAMLHLGIDRPAGRAALFAASLALGALLALIGQVYQTGADTFELFAVWAVMILPWALLGRSAALWVLWLVLANLALMLYFQVRPSWLGIGLSDRQLLWLQCLFNGLALLVWEALAWWRFAWLRPRWAPRLLAFASGAAVTMIAADAAIDLGGDDGIALLGWLAWLGVAWAVYRHVVRDLFVLAGGALSVIVVVAAFFLRVLDHVDAFGYLLVGALVVGMSGGAAWWLRRLAAEFDR